MLGYLRFHAPSRICLTSLLIVVSRVDALTIWHSHIVNTLHPMALNALALRVSRFRFLSNLSLQNVARVPGMRPFWQLWACQKQPWTKMTAPYFGNTRSGRPGRSFLCRRNLNPRPCSSLRTHSSGFVSRPRIRDIRSLRSSGLRVSAIVIG